MHRNNARRRVAGAALSLASLALAAAAHGQVINEIRIDRAGADNDEYFELFGTPGTSLGTFTYLVVGDGATGSGTIEAVIPLTGQSLDAGGFFVAAEATFTLGAADLVTSINFENGDNVTHFLVDGFTGAINQDLDTNDDGVLDLTPWSAEISRVALIEEENPPSGTEFHYGPPTVGPDGTFVPAHVKRCPDGSADFAIGAFDAATGSDTPGTANDCSGPVPLEIYEIQGAAHVSPQLGTLALTEGVVTAITAIGFYMQDPTGDGDDDTSDGLFVFEGSPPAVAVGDLVSVTGTVAEFTPGGTGTGNLSITQLSAPTFSVIGTAAVPAPRVISANDIPNFEVITDDGLVPFDPANDPLDYYETFEGMLVTVPTPLVIGARDRFDEIYVVADAGLNATGLNGRGSLGLASTDNNPERIELQIRGDLVPGFDPAVKVGDVLNDVVGVVDYSFGFFEVRLTQAFTTVPGSLTPQAGTLVPTATGVTLASYNVLNLDPILEDPLLCQDGVDDIDDDGGDGRFGTIAGHIVNSLNSPDIVALQEIQDGNGCEDTGLTDASATYGLLTAAIAMNGGPNYQFADLPPVNNTDGGQPGGNIRVGYLYNPARVALVPGSLERIVDTDLADGDAFEDSRKPLLARFQFNGLPLTVINVHFRSKGGGTPLFGAVFPAINGGVDQRAAQAAEVAAVVADELASAPDVPVVILGDFNEFDWTSQVFDPLTGEPSANVEVLTRRLGERERHTFTFNGNAQALDHILVSNNAAADALIEIVHVNTEFASTPSRGSDHDPLVTRIDLLVDTDGDGVPDNQDNCTLEPNPSQLDTNGDGFGNICDADLDNNGIVNPIDLGLFRLEFFMSGPNDADFNGDEIVNPIDLGILKLRFFQPPGPSGLVMRDAPAKTD